MQENAIVENNARMFATITNEANMMLPLLTQSFEIRIKNNAESHKQLKMCYYGKIFNLNENVAPLLGKTFIAKVDWSALEVANKYMFLNLDNGGSILLNADNIKTIITNKGLALKMYKTWELAAGK